MGPADMKFHYQNTKHNPPESYGDCMRTCVACLLDRDPESVPNWFDPQSRYKPPAGETFEPWRDMEEWLSDAGYLLLKVDVAGELSHVLLYMEQQNPSVLFILAGDGHAVIACGGKILHDPSWLSLGVKEPSHMLFLLPVAMRYMPNDVCPYCSGCGWENPAQQIDKCQRCEGSGYIA
jgi:hypothetical protein